MFDFQESMMEDDLLFKMQSNFMDKFCLDQHRASDLALEIMDLLTLSDSNLKSLSQYYFS